MFPARKSSKLFHFNQTGQGIIEVVVVLGLAAILILALVALSVRSNRSANFSKAEDQAARLAQEWMENLIAARERSTTAVIDTSGNTQDWSFLYSSDSAQTAILSACGANNCLDLRNPSDTIDLGGRIFTRQITTEGIPASDNPCNTGASDWEDIKKFTVVVSWVDTAGTHESTTSSCLRRIS